MSVTPVRSKSPLRRGLPSLDEHLTQLAKISGIMLAYPGLKLGIEGNTDSGQRLSGRARDSGILDDGSGIRQNPAHCVKRHRGRRQQNRRVELVVSGEVIGTTIGKLRMQPPNS